MRNGNAAACATMLCIMSSTASAATLIEILPGGPLPLPEEKAEASILAGVPTFAEPPTENTIGEQIPEVAAKATLDAGISAGFTPVSGAVDTVALKQGKPAKIGISAFDSDDNGDFVSLEKRAVSQSLVTVPNLVASPVVDTIAEASVKRSQNFDLFDDEQLAAFANGALAYQAKIDRVNFAALGFDVPVAPLSVTIKSDLNATLEPVGVDSSGARAQSTASALVVGSTSPIMTTEEGALSYSADPDLTTILFANSVAAGIGGGEFVPEAFFGEPTIVSIDVPPDQKFFLGKQARSSIFLNLTSANGELTGFAQAIVDPVLSFDQDRFEDLYGDDCFDALGTACPAMDTLFSLSLSPFVGNGDAPYVPQVLPSTTVPPVPLPLGAWLLLSGLAMLGVKRRHRGRSFR